MHDIDKTGNILRIALFRLFENAYEKHINLVFLFHLYTRYLHIVIILNIIIIFSSFRNKDIYKHFSNKQNILPHCNTSRSQIVLTFRNRRYLVFNEEVKAATGPCQSWFCRKSRGN